VANFCAECGKPGTLPDIAWCETCITHDRVKATVEGLHELAVNILRHADRATVVRELRARHAQAVAALARGQKARVNSNGTKAPDGDEDGADLQAAIDAAVTAEREAQDADRAAARQNTKRQAQKSRAENDGVTGDALEEIQWKAEQAARNAVTAGAAHETAIAARMRAEKALSEWQEEVGRLEEAVKAAGKAAGNPPGAVPVSMDTATLANPLTVLKYAQGNGPAMAGIMGQVELLAAPAPGTGQAETWLAQGRAEGREAEREEIRKEPVTVGDGHGGMSVHGPRILPGRRA
jgi:hypothetical protein